MGQNETRSEILELARGYLQKFGYNGFSFQTIADALGIRKASIHYYFKSKDEMGLALLDDYIRAFSRWCEKSNPDLSATERMNAYFSIFTDYFRDQDKICPCGVLSSDFNTISKKMRTRVAELYRQHHDWLKETIRYGIETGEFTETVSASEAADTIFAAVQGGLQASRIRGDSEPLKHLKNFVLKSLVGLQKSAKTGSKATKTRRGRK